MLCGEVYALNETDMVFVGSQDYLTVWSKRGGVVGTNWNQENPIGMRGSVCEPFALIW